MRGRQVAVVVLDQMQVFDQQIAPARPVGEQRTHFIERLRIDLAALGGARRAAAAVARRRLHVLLGNTHFALLRREKPL